MAPMFITVHIGISDSMVQVYWSNKKSKSSCHASCADPGIFVRGVQVNPKKKTALATMFFSPQLILQKSNGQFQSNLSFFKVPEGDQHFPGGGGGPTFSRGGPIAYSL